MHATHRARGFPGALVLLPLAAAAIIFAACSGSTGAGATGGVAGVTATPAARATSGGGGGYGGGSSGYGSATRTATPTAAAASANPAAPAPGPVQLTARNDPKLGSYLAGANGMTLYDFQPDRPNQSNCSGQCATYWPPLTVASADQVTAAAGVPGTIGTFKRADGSLQVSWNGIPLYYFAKDAKAGDVSGQGVQDAWWVISPTGMGPADATQVTMAKDAKLGSYLVGGNGLTLYLFKPDKPDQSTCFDKCAQAWPPVIVSAAGKVSAGPGVAGKLGTFKRPDGTLQVSYNGTPLYYFANDAMPGDLNGQGVGNVWFIVAP
jgi:predicted lipoprotein with Yx(FWY)xxD motif